MRDATWSNAITAPLQRRRAISRATQATGRLSGTDQHTFGLGLMCRLIRGFPIHARPCATITALRRPAGGTPMSRLATQLPTAQTIATRIRRGPSGACDIYGDGDLDDWRAVERLRLATCWDDAHKAVDETLEVADEIDTDKFRYHWRRKCWHWTPEQRRAELSE